MTLTVYVFGLTNGSSVLMQAHVKFCILASQIYITSTVEKDLSVQSDPELKFSKYVERQMNKDNRILGLILRSSEYIDMDV